MWCGLWFVISPLVQLKNKPITRTDWPWMPLVVITKRCSTDRLVALLAEKLSSWNPDCMHGVIMISCIHPSAYKLYYLCLRCASRSQRGMLREQTGVKGQDTDSLSSSLCTRMLDLRHACSCSRVLSRGQKSLSWRKLRRQRAQKVCPHGVSRGCTSGCRQMWHTRSSSTSRR